LNGEETKETLKIMIAIKVPVIESEAGWGSRIDDYMVCLSVEDADNFIKEFNSKNNKADTPDWYMYAESTKIPFDLSEPQYSKLKESNRIWWSSLK
jgi:hypothetical protein